MTEQARALLAIVTNEMERGSDLMHQLKTRQAVLRSCATKLRTGAHPLMIEAELDAYLEIIKGRA